ncbi:restriction endonuclease subunit S [Endozoicomonas sp. Mp262]|uniref:restriction endonuclease subunit S n=1 Tax=Endozoicomonas sp. Mp262 TaxID=2919499 RepID=UPI0021D8C09C
MINNLITEHLDIWISSHRTKSTVGRGKSSKLELHGINKLRALILELAVRGKLVLQNSEDEPASVLLERIASEKARLVKEKKIKRQKSSEPISNGEKPFGLPDGWEWVRLSQIFCSILSGGTPSKRESRFWNGEIPWASVKDLGVQRHLSRTQDYITQEGLEAGSKLADTGDILICTRMGLGKIGVALQPLAFNQDLKAVKLAHGVNTDFFLNTYSTIKIKGTGTTVAGIKQEQLLDYVIAIPPEAEQHRIVTKVDELMALCDQLEQEQTSSIAAHQTLVETLLTTLTDSQSAEALAENWALVSEHFDTLFTTEASIDQLKQTILQLAVMGRLVSQNPKDEPASALLERIAVEKARLVKEKIIKRQKSLPTITDEEKPFQLPVGWEWCRLQNITSKITDGDHKTPPRIQTGRRLLSAKNIRDGFLDMNNCDFILEEHYVKSRERCLPEEGDLLIVSVGGTIGRSSLVPQDSKFALVRSVALIKPMLFNSEYLKYAMDSKLLQESIHSNKRGGAQPCLYLSEISKFLFAMPPLNEQHRIVTKVNQLMRLCDHLKQMVQQAQTTQSQLTDAIVEQALNPEPVNNAERDAHILRRVQDEPGSVAYS